MAHTMNRLAALGGLLMTLALIGTHASAAVPHLIRYQGQAVDSQDVPLEGPYTLTFRLYDAETGGTKVWEETQPNVPLTGGHFSVLLGQATPLTVDWSTPLWLSLQVGADPELLPRQRITSAPLSIRAETAERLANSEAISPHNMLKNGSFEQWSAGDAAAPDGWFIVGGGGSVSKRTASGEVVRGLAAVAITDTSPTALMGLGQRLDNVNPSQQPRTYSISLWLRGATPSDTKALVQTTRSDGGEVSGGGLNITDLTTSPKQYTATGIDGGGVVNSLTVLVYAGHSGNDTGTIYLDDVILVEGSTPFAFSPHPQDLTRDISARVYNSTTISIPNNINTPLTFNSERWDTDALHSTTSNTGRLTATTAGKYLIVGHVVFAANTLGVRSAYLRLNGTTFIAGQMRPGAGMSNELSLTTHYDLAAGAYVELVVYQDSGGALNMWGSEGMSQEFGMVKTP